MGGSPEAEAPRDLGGSADADTRANDRVRGRGRFVILDPDRVASDEVHTVVGQIDPKRLAEPSRSVGQRLSTAPPLHLLQADQRLDRPHKYCLTVALGAGDDVGASMDAVAEVHVQMPGGAEHHGIAFGPTSERVAGRIVGGIRLGLDDPSRCRDALAFDDQDLAEQLRCDDGGIASEPRSGNGDQGDSRSWSVASIAR